MKIKTEPASIQQEYAAGVAYKQRIDLYDTVETNENFFNGKCWEGVNAPDLVKANIPLLKRAISQFVAMIVSDDIASQITPRQPGRELEADVLQREVANIIEDEKIRAKNRLWLRDAAVDGDCCGYFWMDADAPTGQKAKGRVRAMAVDNTNVIFGNPHERDVQAQPYILIPMRELVEDLRAEAVEQGATESVASQIIEDTDTKEYNHALSDGLATAIMKLWMNDETGTVWATKVCQKTVIRQPWDLEYRLYPVAYMSWDAVKNSYHGISAIAGLIPNQIFVNLLFSMAMHYVKFRAFPKFAYDKTRLPGGISNKIGEAIGVQGNPSEIVFQPLIQADMSNQVFVMIDKIVTLTQNLIGASDVMLGNAKPENTSAIIALTKSSTIPLEIPKLNFWQFVEDYVRIIIEIIATDYGTRRVVVTDPATGQEIETDFDFSKLRELDFRLNIDVGASAYWSEIMQVQSIDNMWRSKIIQDPIDYLENMPDGIIKNKNRLIKKFKMLQAKLAAMPADENGNPMPPAPPEGGMPSGQMPQGPPA